MSSMLKKSGGLAFKPKAGRRGGTGPATTAPSSQAPSTSASATGTPVAEQSAGTPTPTPTPATVPAPTPIAPESTLPSNHEQTEPSVHEIRQPTAQPEPEPSVDSQPTPEWTILPPQSIVEPLPEPSSASQPVPEDTPAPRRPQDTPASSRAPVTDDLEASTSTPARKPLPVAPGTGATDNQATLEPVTTSTTTSTRLPTAPPSPPHVPDTITAVAPSPPSAPPVSSATSNEPPNTASASAPKKRAPRKRKAPAPEGEAGTAGPAAPRKKRAPRKRQPAQSVPVEDGEAATREEGEGTDGDREGGASRPKKNPRNYRGPSTPEEAEKQQVDHSTTKMGELIWDLGIGKPFKHADAVAERARQARHEAKMRKIEKQKRALGLLPAGEEGGDVSGSRTGTPADDRGGGAAAAMAASAAMDTGGGVGYEVVDGQIVVNQNTLVVDRHAAAQHGSLETVEEDEFSHLTTAASYRRASRAPAATANAWTEEETERFYRLLGMFGCDFESIAAMFPGKNRRMIKCKFNREERLRPRRVNAAVMVRGAKPVGIDIEEYKGFQRATWQETDEIAREQERIAREQREDIRRLRRERREAGLVDGESDNEEAEEGEGATRPGDAPQNPSGMPTPGEMENEVPAAG